MNGLYYNRARYYSPTLQRFISQDPIGFAGGDANLYRYVLNDPINIEDPLGLTQIPINVDRVTADTNATTGTLSVGSQPIGVTLELPDRNNQRFVSRIPEGNYPAKLYNSPHLGYEDIRLQDVLNHNAIEIHKGNLPGDSSGCILVGRKGVNDQIVACPTGFC